VTARTVAEHLAAAFARHGVRRIFGVPGGGSSLDVIEAAARLGIDFILTRDETAAVMMAAATAELTGAIGVALTTKGPGTANAVNGIAYAALDRAPVVFLTDGFTAAEASWVTHQVFDQAKMLAPLTKARSRLEGPDVVAEIERLIGAARSVPFGPVLIELTSEAAKIRLPDATMPAASSPVSTAGASTADRAAMTVARQLLASARKPVLILGLEAREAAAAIAVIRLADALGCPVLATYKAKGVVADSDPRYISEFTSGSAEAECVEQADLILLCGLDPVELLRQKWRYRAPVVDVASTRHPVHYLVPAAGLYGSIAATLAELQSAASPSSWASTELIALRARLRALLACQAGRGVGPQQIVEVAAKRAEALTEWPRISVDAGAHMFSAMAFWPCLRPCDVLISNGLATMGFALPAAIASALQEPARTSIAFTGDGGLFMCLAELSTAVQCAARIVVIVFNDGALSLIDIKQQQRGLPTRGVRWDRPDFAAVMVGLGGRGYRAQTVEEYERAVDSALSGTGPALIDVTVDPGRYLEQLKALRG
jgi:acetolactate synthase-1/2/3 large subunit